jgi:amino acid adenylation domain-containing protein
MSAFNDESRNESVEQKRARLATFLRSRPQAAATTQPLSEGQRALWFLHQLAPHSPAYNIAFTARIVSAIDPAALQRAFDVLVDRHDALRSRIEAVGGEPVQHVQASMAAPFESIDASEWSEERVLEEIAAEIKRPFDLARGPLLRVRIYTRRSGDSYLAVTFHHIAMDGWSLWVCLSELKVLYTAALRGQQADLPHPRSRYRDYVHSESEMLASDAQVRHQEFWRATLGRAGMPVTNLPTDRIRPRVPRYLGAAHRFELDPALTARLRRLAQQERSTLQMGVLALFFVLLHRYTSQDDLIVGYVASGRVRPEFETLVGYLANALPLRSRLPTQASFRELLGRTKVLLLEALDHQDYPFPRVVDALSVTRDVSRSPVFQTLFVFEKPHLLGDQDIAAFIVGEPGARLDLGDLLLESLLFPAQQEGQFDLTFVAVERKSSLAYSIDYSTDLFDDSTIRRMAGHFQQLTAAALADPDAPLSTLGMVTAEEIEQIDLWNHTAQPFPDRCFHQLVESHAARQPEAVAVVFDDIGLSYAELNRRANRFARHLRRLGVGPDVVVGLCVERSSTLIVAALGILKAGGAFLPLDPAYPAARLAYMIEDSDVGVLVTQQSLVAELPRGPRVVLVDRDAGEWQAESSDDLSSSVTPDHLMYVIYTSGSTGRPKGVLLRHRGLVNVATEQQRMFGVRAGAQVLQFASLSFDAAVFEISMALGSGGTLHMARPEELLPGRPLLDTLRRRAINVVTLPPSALMNVPVTDLPQLTTITVAGEACPAELISRWAPGRAFFNLYGPTEATIWSTALRCGDAAGAPTIGRPIANTQTYVLDAESRLVPVGVPGELHIGGAGVARGYHRQRELTAARFIANPFSADRTERLYKTGDLVRQLATGEIEFLGRIDHQVKVRGFRIELGEIETVLAQHPDVHETVVTVREDTPGAQRIIAYVVTHASARPSSEVLKAFVRTRLPEYMVPSAVVFLEVLPVTPAKKIDRAALPPPGNVAPRGPMVAPASDAERRIAAIWRDILKVDGVSIDDNFFDIGGSSLLVAQVHARLSEFGN